MKKIFGLMAALSFACVAMAQGSYLGEGELISPANMNASDVTPYAQQEYSYMSARVAGMGGAFVSLGADLSSMSINPAGLGMYTSSALNISMDFSSSRSRNNFNESGSLDNTLGFNQIGTALNLYQGTGPMVSYTFGFAYNKLADLNYNRSYGWRGDEVSIAEFFAEQMYSINPSILITSADPFRNQDIYLSEWGGVLAYQTMLIDPKTDDANPEYGVPHLPLSSSVNGHMRASSYGSVGEYAFSSGFNIANILYLGLTLGVQDVSQTLEYSYSEEYTHEVPDPTYLSHMNYRPVVSNYGTGINLKLGAILRPIEPLRLGVAYHTPTTMILTRDYYASMTTLFEDGYESEANTLLNHYTIDYNTPSKLLLGASYTLSNLAVVSFDYDLVWYDGTYFFDDAEVLNQVVVDEYTRAHNMRVGLEVRPLPQLYLRGGYAYYGSPYQSRLTDSDQPFWGTFKTHSENFSLGIGWRFKSGSVLDVAWTKGRSHYTSSILYEYYSDFVAPGSDPIYVAGPVVKDNVMDKNVIVTSYTLRF